jgi:hypothetical protein
VTKAPAYVEKKVKGSFGSTFNSKLNRYITYS